METVLLTAAGRALAVLGPRSWLLSSRSSLLCRPLEDSSLFRWDSPRALLAYKHRLSKGIGRSGHAAAPAGSFGDHHARQDRRNQGGLTEWPVLGQH